MKFVNFDVNVQSVFNNDENDFRAFSKLLVDTYKGTLDGLTPKQANDKIVEIFRAVLGCDENSSKAEVRKAIRRHQVEIFEIIEETVDNLLVSGWAANPFFNEYVEVKNLADGDTNEFYIEDDSIFSVMKVSGNHHDIIRQRIGAGEYVPVATEWVAIKFYAEFERVLTGAEDWARLVAKVAKSLDAYVNQTVYNALNGIGASLGTETQWYKTGAMNAGKLRTLCTDVAAATGREVAIMGTRAALANVLALQNVAWASGDMKNEVNRNGMLSYWEGIRLVELENAFKQGDTSAYLINNQKLFIMPIAADNKFIKLVYEGDTQTYSITDPIVRRDMTYEYELQTKLGVAVITNMKFGIWNLAT